MKKLALLIGLFLAPILAFSQPTPASGGIPATQAEVNAGTVANKYVSPLTLASWTGGGGAPGGSNGDIQYNNSGAFGGITPGTGVVTAIGNAVNTSGGIVTYAGTFAGTLGSATTATTQSAGDNSTKIATTAYADAAGGVTASNTVTLTNKRITARVATLTDAATVTPATDSYDGGILTSLSQTTAFAVPTGTPTDFQRYILRIKSSTTRTISFSSSSGGYRGSADLALPTATSGSSLTDYLVFQWNAADSKWDLVGRNFGF